MARTKSAGPMDLALGKAIRARREALGLSQSQVAAAIGLTFQQLQKYERGANRVTVVTFVGLAIALDIRTVDLLEAAQLPGVAATRATTVAEAS